VSGVVVAIRTGSSASPLEVIVTVLAPVPVVGVIVIPVPAISERGLFEYDILVFPL
jgi:hypothetical protein